MKHTSIAALVLTILVCALLPSCKNDDTDFSQYFSSNNSGGKDTVPDIPVLSDTLSLAIVWNGTTATVSGETTNDSVRIAISGADVTIVSTITARYVEVTVSGATADGSLLFYGEKKWGLVLDGVSIANNDGPAINNQCGKALYVTVADSTTNTLADGVAYAEHDYSQKGTLFSEGEIYINGTGTLNVTANCKSGIASDDYIVIEATAPDVSPSGPTIAVSSIGTSGIKVNDGMEILGGVLSIDVTADGARGIKNDARMTIGGGQTTITTSGDCKIENVDGIIDTTSCAGIKCDSLFTMTAGELTILSTGDGGKGINSGQNVEFSGGTLVVTTTGGNDMAKPKGVKSDTGIILSGGSFTVSVNKSWACDNGSDSDDIVGMLTIEGTPTTMLLKKKEVNVVY